MHAIDKVKTVSAIVASTGVGAIVGNLIKATTPLGTGLVKRVFIGVGAFVLGSMVGDYVSKYIDNVIDSAVEYITNVAKEQEPVQPQD